MDSRRMAARLGALGRFHWNRLRGRRLPDELIFAVTSACNAACDFCYYWEELNQGGPELTLAEIERFAATMDPFRYLWITGGEPFLRADLPEIVGIFARTNKITGVHIPTNGIATDRTVAGVERILAAAPGVFVKVLLPIVGLPDEHDRSFAVPGAFRRTLETARRLCALSKRAPDLTVSFNTVLSNRNIDSLPEILALTAEFSEAGHCASPVRGTPKDPGLEAPTPAQWRRASELLFTRRRDTGLLKRLNESRFLHQQNLVLGVLAGRGLPFTCAAGDSIAVVEARGEVRVCELKGRAANLRDFELDFRKLWSSPALERARSEVPGCSCTHACFMSASVNRSPTRVLASLVESRLEAVR